LKARASAFEARRRSCAPTHRASRFRIAITTFPETPVDHATAARHRARRRTFNGPQRFRLKARTAAARAWAEEDRRRGTRGVSFALSAAERLFNAVLARRVGPR
jgi:hypothetical protein